MKNQKYVPNKKLIKRAVQDSINDFLNSVNDSSGASPRINSEIPDISKYIRTFSNINLPLDEGLIKTYPIDKTINYIAQKYDLDSNQLQIKPMNNGLMTINIITIVLPNNINKAILGDIKHDLRTCGYFNTQRPIPIRNTDFFLMVFEPKFSQNITKIVKDNFHYLYHSTPKIYIDKIMKNGLIPKSKNSLFFYPDRTFLMVGDKLRREQENVLKKVQHVRSMNIDPNNPLEKNEYSLITIDVSRLPENVSFYCDPMSDLAIFTYDNIPPNVISNIEDFTL